MAPLYGQFSELYFPKSKCFSESLLDWLLAVELFYWNVAHLTGDWLSAANMIVITNTDMGL